VRVHVRSHPSLLCQSHGKANGNEERPARYSICNTRTVVRVTLRARSTKSTGRSAMFDRLTQVVIGAPVERISST
jgi:hypothetical protein